MAVGSAHTCALDHLTRLVNCWGDGSKGQLGHGFAASSPEPVGVVGTSDAVKVSAGSLHSCSVEASGEVKCWGDNYHGQLGHGGLSSRFEARPAVRLDGPAMDVSAGGSHTCALLSRGHKSAAVKCWGMGSFGQLGHGTRAGSRYPVEVEGLDWAVKVCAGALHSCAVEQRGVVKCWGWGAFGQLGDTIEDSLVPRAVEGVAGARDVACGYKHTCALLDFWQIWQKTARNEMTLEEAVSSVVMPSPIGLVW